MTSQYSDISKVSIASQAIMDQAARTSSFKAITGGDAFVSDEMMSNIWGSFGLYISRQMRMGRGVTIPNFGTFTFSAPEVTLSGVTNPEVRDKQYRLPVFIVSKEFVKGKNLKTGIYIDNHIRPYLVQTSGSIQVTKINLAEISHLTKQNKETTKYAIDRVIRVISDKARANSSVDLEIPGVGTFQVRNQLVAVKFQQSFVHNTRAMPKRPLSERKTKGEMKLTAETLSVLNYNNTLKQGLPVTLDQTAQQYLKNNYDYETQSRSSLRPSTAGARSTVSGFRSIKKAPVQRPQTGTGIQPSSLRDQNGFLKTYTGQLNDLQYAIKRLKFWIRQNWYRSEDAFIEMCNQAIGRTSDQKVKINFKEFEKAAEKMELLLNNQQTQSLFNHLDVNKDGYINFQDWKQIIKDDNHHILRLKDVIYKKKLHADDVLKTLGLSREHPPVGIEKLTNGLKFLDLSLNLSRARVCASAILGDRSVISMQELIELLECVEEDDKIFDLSWFKDILFKIKQKLISNRGFNDLKRVFERYDEHNIGSLDIANFKTVLMESSLKLHVKEINRIVRYLPKVGSNRINYYNFLQLVERIDISSTAPDIISDIKDFAEKLSKIIKQKKVDIIQFLKMIRSWAINNHPSDISESGDITTEQFSDYLYQFAFQKTDKLDLDNFVEELDLDCDGFIKENDVKSFLSKYNYFDQIFLAPNQSTRELQLSKSAYAKTTTLGTKALYPLEQLSEEKVDQVLISIRKVLDIKKMGPVQLFKLLDYDQDGFITIQEFSEQIDKIVPLSQPIKDGFFAFMDEQHIGIVDMKQFIKIMQKSVVNKMEHIKQDNFDWELNIMLKIRDWFFMEKLTVEDAFRTIDQTYRGFIMATDLEEFLIKILKMKKENITDAKINRLFKIMDVYKRGRITVDDLRRFLCEDFSYGFNQTVMGNQTIDNFSSFDWKLNARQQIGIVLTRRFTSLQDSFDKISGYKKKLLYIQFKKWVQDTISLRGFDLSERLLQELFSDLDPHKKGYLTESDWVIAFKGYGWKNQVMQEVKEMINRNFENILKAYEFFCQGDEEISYSNFKKSINYLFPRRFIESDIIDIWNIASEQQKKIDFSKFRNTLGNANNNYTESYVDIKQRPLNTIGTLSVDGRTMYEVSEIGKTTRESPFSSEGLLDRIRRFLRSSNADPEQHLRDADYNQSGLLTNLEFRNAMKKLNFALSSQEVDILINICGLDGKLKWKEFLQMIKLRETDHRIVNRAKQRLQHITELIYTYLLSPKDAFRKFDTDAQHALNFDSFHNFIKEIHQLAGEDMPPYSITKDLFEYIDKRRDGFIDMTEWMDVFQQFEFVPKASVLKNLKPQFQNSNNQLNYQKIFRPRTAQPQSTKSFSQKSSSKNFFPSGSSQKNARLSVNGNYKGNLRGQNSWKVTSQRYFTNVNQPFHELDVPIPHQKLNNANQNEVLQRNFKFDLPQQKYRGQKLGQWEASKDFDIILTSIGKNRKYLLDIFKQYERLNKPITYKLAMEVIQQMLRNQGQFVKAEGWPVLLKFAEKDGLIDYKFMLDVYKDRIKTIDTHPKKSHITNNYMAQSEQQYNQNQNNLENYSQQEFNDYNNDNLNSQQYDNESQQSQDFYQ